MLEITTIPVLIKAINFLFDECSKILQERRDKRLKETTKPASHPPQTQQPDPSLVIQSKFIALETKISQNAWLDSQSQIEHLTELLQIHLRNHQLASKQYAMWGDALVPPIITNNLLHEEKEIAKITNELQNVLSKIYEKKVEAIPEEQFFDY